MKYMPQDVFNYAAVQLAMTAYLDGDVLKLARSLAREYELRYADDDISRELLTAAAGIQRALPSLYPITRQSNDTLAASCSTISETIKRYQPSGRRRLLLDKWNPLATSNSKVPDKSQICVANISLYYMGISNGTMPIKDINEKSRSWTNYLLQLFASLLFYSICKYIYWPIERPDVKPGDEYIIYAVIYPLYFLYTYLPIAVIAVLMAKIIPAWRSFPVPTVLARALVPGLLIALLLVFSSWWVASRDIGTTLS